MLLTRITLMPAGGVPTDVRPALVVDAIWSATGAGAPVEHISAQWRSDHLDVGIFVRTQDRDDGARLGAEIVGIALATSPVLEGWRLAGPGHRPPSLMP